MLKEILPHLLVISVKSEEIDVCGDLESEVASVIIDVVCCT